MITFFEHKENLKNFCSEFGWPNEAYLAHDAVLDALKDDKRYFELIDLYFDDKEINLYNVVKELREKFKQADIHSETAELLYFVLIVPHLKERYKKEGIDLDIWHNSMCDLGYKLMECKKNRDIWGTWVAEWFVGFFDMSRFALGRLQFEVYKMPEIFDANGKKLYDGEKCINVHIPSSGPLYPEDCEKAFRMAAEFYADEFEGDTVLFHCYSWLLFPEHRNILPPTSRVLSFMDFFTIIQEGVYDDGLDLWRIFDTTETDIEKLPADSSMRRAYINLLKEGKKSGWGRGVIEYKKV